MFYKPNLMVERHRDRNRLVLHNHNNNTVNRSEQKMGGQYKKQVSIKVYTNRFLRESALYKGNNLENNFEMCCIKSRKSMVRCKDRLNHVNKTTNQKMKIWKTEINEIQNQMFVAPNKLNEVSSRVGVKTQSALRGHTKSKSQVAPMNLHEQMGIFKPNSGFFANNELQNNYPLKQNGFSSEMKMKKKGLSLSRALEFFSSLTNDYQVLDQLKMGNRKQIIREQILNEIKQEHIALSDLTKKIAMVERVEKRPSICSSHKVKRRKQVSSNDFIADDNDNFELNGWEVVN